MKITLTTITLWVLSLGAYAQVEVPVPYNPDGNADGFITLPDLLDFLALYGSDFAPEAIASDSSSAIIHMGQGDYFDCASWCAGLEGNWKVMDEILVGRYKDQIRTMTSNNATWMDRRSNNGMSYHSVPTLQPDNWSVAQSAFNADRDCICQTRVIQPDVNPQLDYHVVVRSQIAGLTEVVIDSLNAGWNLQGGAVINWSGTTSQTLWRRVD
jgi:hypothetical protein